MSCRAAPDGALSEPHAQVTGAWLGIINFTACPTWCDRFRALFREQSLVRSRQNRRPVAVIRLSPKTLLIQASILSISASGRAQLVSTVYTKHSVSRRRLVPQIQMRQHLLEVELVTRWPQIGQRVWCSVKPWCGTAGGKSLDMVAQCAGESYEKTYEGGKGETPVQALRSRRRSARITKIAFHNTDCVALPTP